MQMSMPMVAYKLTRQEPIHHVLPAIHSILSSCLPGGLLHNGKQCITYTLETEIYTFLICKSNGSIWQKKFQWSILSLKFDPTYCGIRADLLPANNFLTENGNTIALVNQTKRVIKCCSNTRHSFQFHQPDTKAVPVGRESPVICMPARCIIQITVCIDCCKETWLLKFNIHTYVSKANHSEDTPWFLI